MKKSSSSTAASLTTQWLNRHAWLAGCDIETEFSQARDEGRDLTTVEAEFKHLIAAPKPSEGFPAILGGARDAKWLADATRLMDKVQTLPYRKDYRYVEPSDLAGIRAARPKRRKLNVWRGDRAEFMRRLHGGWLGRICGCMLGKPVEGWSRESIRVTAEETGNWPLQNYARIPTPAEMKRIAARKPKQQNAQRVWKECMRDHLNGMVVDDDTNYTVTGLAILKRFGATFRPLDVASVWTENIPIFRTCTAERVAYRNFVMQIVPPQSAVYRNPYREWIGAQIRADFFGYANPGNPALAADWAWRDASISHIKNGIYGEMWVAAMLAAAYVETDWVKIIRAGLGEISAKCRLAEDIEKILAAHQAGLGYEAVTDLVHKQWDATRAHDWCHTNSNAQIVAIGLLWGEDDYEKTITRAVMAGFDTDCNGATCGSLWGIKHGVDALPKKWTRPIRDLIRTDLPGYYEVKISKVAADMVAMALKANG